MGKYWHIFKFGIQTTLVYRVNFLARAVFGMIPLAAVLMLWKAIYKDDPIAGYSLDDMVCYYLIAMLVTALTSVTDDDWQIATDIRDGNVNQLLLKPMNYLGYRLSLFAAGRLVYLLAAALPLLILFISLRDYFRLPPDFLHAIAFVIAVMMAGLLQFLISYCMALLAFWVLEVATFIFILFAFETLASGSLFPLDLFPPIIRQILEASPFPYVLFFPVSIYLGRIDAQAIMTGIAIQAAWIFAATALAQWIWNRGIRRYAAAGG